MRRTFSLGFCVIVIAVAAWLGRAGQQKTTNAWTEVAPGVLRSPGPVAGYALISGDKALLVDAPASTEGLAKHGIRTVDRVLLTHYHRAVCEAINKLPKQTKIQAPK